MLAAHLADGTLIDHTGTNQRGDATFLPFGETAGRNDVLRMELESTGGAPLIAPERSDNAYFVIGIRAGNQQNQRRRSDAPQRTYKTEVDASQRHSPLEVTLAAGADRVPLKIIEDSSEGFMRTGVCVFDLSGVQVASDTMTLEFRAPRGFDRAPRILRIEPNVIPISQGQIEREIHIGQGKPDQSFDLETPGLEFEPSTDPVIIEVAAGAGPTEWKKCERLSDCGPNDRVYELDPVAARITFGNGLNGQIPPLDAQIFASYCVSAGTGGNTARNRKWAVRGFAGVFGTNYDPVAGGQDPSGWLEQRREARRLAKNAHALVSAADIEAAARALPALGVARAWVAAPQAGAIETGTVTLIAMQERPAREPMEIPETARWLDAIRRRLAPRMPLGSRLVVEAPRYAEFSLRARMEAELGRDPATVKKAVEDELHKRLALAKPGGPQRSAGVPVTSRDITAWIQALPQVRRVTKLSIQLASGRITDEVKVARNGLPRIDFSQTTIDVVRAERGGSR
jgi:predicted phage baseplate assembly protein